MLTFLAICARKRLIVDAYEDEACGQLKKVANGKLWMAHVTLRPRVRFAPGRSVDEATLADIHHQSHEECFIAQFGKDGSCCRATAIKPALTCTLTGRLRAARRRGR